MVSFSRNKKQNSLGSLHRIEHMWEKVEIIYTLTAELDAHL